MNEHEIRRAILAANEAAVAAWERYEAAKLRGDATAAMAHMGAYRAALAQLTDMHELLTRATGRMLIGTAA